MLDCVMVINLLRRVDRRQTMDQQLTKHLPAIPVEYVSAIDGAAVDDYLAGRGFSIFPNWKDPASTNPYHCRDLRRGEIGCALSHRELWQRAVDQRLERVLVLEDDAILLPGFFEALKKRLEPLERLAPLWDLLYVGRKPLAGTEMSLGEGLVVPKFSYGTYAYVLSLKGASRLLASGLENNIIPADEFLPALYATHPRNDVRRTFGSGARLKAYATDPPLARHSPELDSDTESSRDIVSTDDTASS